MPIYEFECRACQTQFEELVRSSAAEPQVACPKCGGRRIERRPSVFSARAAAASTPLPKAGCGRCGDPNGPCAIE